MNFDLITWALGFLLTKATSKTLEQAFPQTLRRDLENEIEKWASSISKTTYLHPATLFSVVSSHCGEKTARPALEGLRGQLLDLTIPTKEQWLEAFFEQWSIVRKELGQDVQPFFLLSGDDARFHLSTLSERIYRRCCQDHKKVLPHLVQGFANIKEELATIKEGQAELHKLLSLMAIPSQPIHGDEATKKINKQQLQELEKLIIQREDLLFKFKNHSRKLNMLLLSLPSRLAQRQDVQQLVAKTRKDIEDNKASAPEIKAALDTYKKLVKMAMEVDNINPSTSKLAFEIQAQLTNELTTLSPFVDKQIKVYEELVESITEELNK